MTQRSWIWLVVIVVFVLAIFLFMSTGLIGGEGSNTGGNGSGAILP